MNALRLFLAGLTTALVSAATLALTPSAAFAAPDARIDAQIRPCFGVLTDPATAQRCKPAKRRGPGGPGRPPPIKTTIDCAMAPPGVISDTIAKAWDGVTITLKSSTGQPCREAVVINRPARLVGDYSRAPTFAQPLLVAPGNMPCIRAAPGIWFDIENIAIVQPEGGSAPCIVGQSATLAVVNSLIGYSGAGGAISLAGVNSFVLDRSAVVSRSQEPAVAVRGQLKILNSTIASAVTGLKAGTSGDSRISRLDLVRLDDWTGSRRSAGSAGLVLTEVGASDLVEIEGLDVLGFSRGVYVAGAGEVSFRHPSVRGADWAMLVEGPEVRIVQAQLSAAEVGLYAASGTTYIAKSHIEGVMRSGIFAERGAQVRAVDTDVGAKSPCLALKTGYFTGALTCRPWFEAPQLGGSRNDPVLPTFDSVQAIIDSERSGPRADLRGGPAIVAAPIPGAPNSANGAPKAPVASQGGPSK